MCRPMEGLYFFKERMKGFAFRNQRSKLKISNLKSQFNKQNEKKDNQPHQLAILPLPKLTNLQENSSFPQSPLETTQKVTFFRTKPSQDSKTRLASADHLADSKQEKRSFSQNESFKSKKDLARVGSVRKIDRNESTKQIRPPTSKSLKLIDQKKGSMREAVEQLISLLKRQYIIQQNHIKFYTIKKQNLEEMLSYSFGCLTSREKAETLHSKYAHFGYLKSVLARLAECAQQELLKVRSGRLKLQKYTVKYSYGHNAYQGELGAHRLDIQELLQEKEQLKRNNQFHHEKNDFYKKEIQENMLEIRNQIAEKNKLEETIRMLGDQKDKLQADITEHTELLKETKLTEEKITNFVNQQSNLMLRMVSEDYKRIESDMYEYAVYLQSNQMASDLNYQPAPFKNIEENITDEMKTLNRTIIQDAGIDLQLKNKMMRDFVIVTMQKLKKKDCQLLKLLEFKTKYIRKYVSNMQKWLDNWTLKQEYLVNLRNQFLIDTNSLNKKIGEMRELVYCGDCKGKFSPLFESIVELYHKVELNYKMGNSFY